MLELKKMASWQLALRHPQMRHHPKMRRAMCGLSLDPTYSNDAVKRLLARDWARRFMPGPRSGVVRLGGRIKRQFAERFLAAISPGWPEAVNAR
jgi:hypothetical protein